MDELANLKGSFEQKKESKTKTMKLVDNCFKIQTALDRKDMERVKKKFNLTEDSIIPKSIF